MTNIPDEDIAPFRSEYQNAIFQFLFLLIDLYAKEMSFDKAVEKACDWLVSLAEQVKKTNLEIVTSKDTFSNLVQQAQRDDTKPD